MGEHEPRPRRTLAAYAGIVAISAYAGAFGLITGTLATSGAVDQRLPLHSPVFGGLALALVVGASFIAIGTSLGRRTRQSA